MRGGQIRSPLTFSREEASLFLRSTPGMNRKVAVAGMISLLVVALAILLNLLLGKPDSFSGTVYGEPYPPVYSFQLTDANGRQVNISDFRGKIVLLFFGFTYCPDVCPTTLAELKLVMNDLDEKADQVQV